MSIKNKYDIDYVMLKDRSVIKCDSRVANEMKISHLVYDIQLITTQGLLVVKFKESTTLIPLENVKSIVLKEDPVNEE